MNKLNNFLNKVGQDKNVEDKKTFETKKVNNNNKSQKKHRKPQAQSQTQRSFQSNGKLVRVYPLGGFEEVGKNMTVFETEKDIVIVDMGLQFPEENMYGVNYVIPDISCLEKKTHKIRGIVITHGHLDHIGAVQHLMPKLKYPPIYGTALTMGLVTKRLDEAKITSKVKQNVITENDKLKFGDFNLEFFRVNHSIPDGIGIIFDTPAGKIVHTGDFKFDFTPADDKPANFSKIASLGNDNVLALMSDSTNATSPGYTVSEKVVGEELERVIANSKGRILIATFSSLISRIDQVINYAHKHNKKVFLSGRSMEQNIEIAEKLGYIHAPRGVLRKLDHLHSVPDSQAIIITTGSQGEEMSALSRISQGTHSKIKLKPHDTIVLSSSPIIGNETAVVRIINNLVRQGVKVVTNKNLDVHTSGHAKQEDLKLMMSLVKPKYLIPVHGELYMRAAHKDVAMSIGIEEKNIPIIENGDILEFKDGCMRKSKSKVSTNNIMIDGRGEGNSGGFVQKERQIMSEAGAVIILIKALETGNLACSPKIISKGFVYQEEGRNILDEIQATARKAYEAEKKSIKEMNDKSVGRLRDAVKKEVGKLIRKRLDRFPLVLPIIIRG